MIAIIIAMQEELHQFQKNGLIIKQETYFNKTFYLFNYNHKDYVLAFAGIGSVNASFTTSLIYFKYQPEKILNFGAVGGIHQDAKILDLILVEKASFFDYDVPNRLPGQTPGEELFFNCDSKLLNDAKKIIDENKIDYHLGIVSSGSTFVNKDNFHKFEIFENHNIFSVDMELAAIIQTANILQIPVASFKYVSDCIYNNDSSADFNANIDEISKRIWNLFTLIG